MGDHGTRGVEQHRVPDRAGAAGQHRPDLGGVELGIAADQLVQSGTCETEGRGIEPQLVDGARLHPPDGAGRGGGQLIETIVTVHHQHAGAAARENPGGHLGQVGERASDQTRPRTGRIGQRAKQIEHRRDADLAAHRRGVAIRRMKMRREAESDPHLGEAAYHLLGPQVDAHTQLLERVGSAGQRGCRAVAVLDHGHPAGRHHDGGHRRQIHRVGPVAARTDDVDGIRADLRTLGIPGKRDRVRQHGVGQLADLVGGRALHPHRHPEGRDLCRGGRPRHDLVHGPGRLPRRQVTAVGQLPQYPGPGMFQHAANAPMEATQTTKD